MKSANVIISEKEEKKSYLFPTDMSVKDIELQTDRLEMAVVRFVRKLGIRPHLKGYHLLIQAILLSLESPDLLRSLTKELYPKIADERGINVKSVERNIRKAIESAYEYDPERVQSAFYYKVDRPYISEVISIAVESIRYEF